MSNYPVGKVKVDTIDEALEDLINKVELKSGLSFLIRAKDEEQLVKPCLESIQKIADEIIFVDNHSNDQTLEIAKSVAAKYSNIYIYQYNINVTPCGELHEKAVEEKSDNTLATFYNWGLSKVTRYNVIKWDCDFICINENLNKMINDYHLKTRDDMFAIWFTGKTLFYGKYLKENDNYDEFRVFSKKNGFQWNNYRKCETAAYYVWNSQRCYFNGYADFFTNIQSKNLDTYKKNSPPIFYEVKTQKDIKTPSSMIDIRDLGDNIFLNILDVVDMLKNILEIISHNHRILITLPNLNLGGGNLWAVHTYRMLIDTGFNVKIYCDNLSKNINDNIFNHPINVQIDHTSLS